MRRPVAGGLPSSPGREDLSVGAGLLAKAVGQSTHVLADPPPSRASPLPHLICGVLPSAY
ncbi:hypothetical protein F1720_26375 [Pseudomonas brenneri]|uniref:Uncharacterized protein n=1 Tax=Pseudomonas brenneri TaxID=129817 RepID=A0A5B2UHZ1_9PSED|nr:hypothetical protein [Pseudomonas brenneri]KAA2226424.1 hypothetical protein F1720_26375 [Pseudomonas brenneri]